MSIAIEIFLVMTTAILPYILGSLQYAKNLDYHKNIGNAERLINSWVKAISIIIVTVYIAINRTGDLSSVGIYVGDTDKNYKASLLGFAIVLGSLYLWVLITKLWNKDKQQESRKTYQIPPHAVDVVQYKTLLERISYLITLALRVFGEDLISRGYLVLMLSTRTGMLGLWILVSISCSVLTHLYQGKNLKTIITHILFAIYFIGITLITKNLVTAIASHLIYDLVWVFSIWRNANKDSVEKDLLHQTKAEKVFYIVFIVLNLLLFREFFHLLGFSFAIDIQ